MQFKNVPASEISGMSGKIQKLLGQYSEELGYIGEIDGKEVVFLTKPLPIGQISHLVDQIMKRPRP